MNSLEQKGQPSFQRGYQICRERTKLGVSRVPEPGPAVVNWPGRFWRGQVVQELLTLASPGGEVPCGGDFPEKQAFL